MKALSVSQPAAYLAGVLAGDGYLSQGCLGLHCADKDFAVAFAEALGAAYGLAAQPILEKSGYWRVRANKNRGPFEGLRSVSATTPDERRAWLRGFFDSDGSARFAKLKRGTHSYSRCVSFVKSYPEILAAATAHLDALGFPSYQHEVKPTKGHHGTRPVYQITIRSSEHAYQRFAAEVGSSIGRKQTVLDAIAASYCADLSAAARDAQLLGAVTKRARATSDRLPRLLAAIREYAGQGGGTTYRELASLDGYWSARKTLGMKHSEIVSMALASGGAE